MASHDPTPGGAAAGAVSAAQAAALIGMVARFTTGKRFASYQQEVTEICEAADAHAQAALQLADEDTAAANVHNSRTRAPLATEQGLLGFLLTGA